MRQFLKLLNFKGIKISKRQQFVFIIILLTLGLITTQLVSFEQRLGMVIFLGVACFVLSLIALRDDLHGVEYLTLTILPVAFTVAIAFFYFLLPVRWLTRLPTAIIYALGMYVVLLTENIYNVAANRSIQLLRVAHFFGMLITLVTVFLLTDTVFSFHLHPIFNSLLVFAISLPLVYQSLWSMELTPKLSGFVIKGALSCSMVFAQITFILSLWPINTTIFALFLTTIYYTVVGILQHYQTDRLYPNILREYLAFSVLSFILIIFTTRWTG